jgi:2-keto-4-pentenoate hydratase/2-oxohepta-3-ene-1,7-dioic acid hydratase in catechol pathway
MPMSKFVKIRNNNQINWGRVEEDSIILLDKAPWLDFRKTDQVVPFNQKQLVAPAEPSKVVLVGLNYREHVKESQSVIDVPEEPVIFIKPLTAIIGPNDEIPRYAHLERVDYEGELAVIIGKMLFRAGPDEIRSAIFGYTCLNDVTARLLQKKDIQWTRAKGFDGFCPVGPWIVTDIEATDLKIETFLNNEKRQSGRTSEQIWNIFDLIKFISDVMTLLPGDIISTGTPRGVGPIAPGDIVRIEIENIGILENKVKAA